MEYRSTIQIDREQLNKINQFLEMTGDELYNKFGLKRDETITYTARFEDDFEADIKVVICDGEDTPYIDAILFDDSGCELIACEPMVGPLEGEYSFYLDVSRDEPDIYYVVVEAAEQLEDEKIEDIKTKIKKAIKEEISKLVIEFPQKETCETAEDCECGYLDIIHDIRDNFNWNFKNTFGYEYDDFIYEEMWEQLINLLPNVQKRKE